jgi:ADP-ribose pyrophosphatase YjhB (NUDIX family)
MVQRKHSLGYMEFMRGKYEIKNIEEIEYLLKQMTPMEINEINTRDFDYLWNMLWDNNPNSTTTIKNKHHYKEYIISKQKFYELKMNNSDLLTNTKHIFNFNEWGFPKGRREMYETDLVCAMREFEEETNYNENEYSILDESNIIKENLVGTNGVNYRHNYFLAIIHKKQINDRENKEIGDINFMNKDNCMSVIRPYHRNKQQIITKIHNLIVNFLIENTN